MSSLSAGDQLQFADHIRHALLTFNPQGPPLRSQWQHAQDDTLYFANTTPAPLKWAKAAIIGQAAFAILLLLVSLARPVLPPLPMWLRPFAREDVSTRRPRALTGWTMVLGVVSAAGLAVSLAWILLYRAHDPLEMVPAVPWLAAALITVVKRPTVASKTLLALYGTLFLANTVPIAVLKNITIASWRIAMVNIGISSIALLVSFAMPLREPSAPKDGIASKSASSSLRSPEDDLALWQWMTVSWMAPLIRRGTEETLQDEDVWKLPYEFQHSRLHILFRDIKGSILMRLLRANGRDLVFTSSLGVIEAVTDLSIPLVLKKLLESIQAGNDHVDQSIFWAAAILLIRLVSCQSAVFTLWFSRRCYERSRGEMITAIYAKTLTRKTFGEAALPLEVPAEGTDGSNDASNAQQTTPEEGTAQEGQDAEADNTSKTAAKDAAAAKDDQPASTGKILNLMRNDVYEVAQRFWDFPQFITFPLRFVLSFVFVYKLVGWSCLLGLASTVFTNILSGAIIWGLVSAEKKRRVATDNRLQATTQFIEAIRHLRWYDWQGKWLDRVMRTRSTELGARLRSGCWGMGLGAVTVLSSVLFPVITFFAYTFLAGRHLTVDVAFPALQLFMMLEASLKMLPMLTTVLVNASVAMGRIEKFMAEPDKEETDGDSTTENIKFSDTALAWPGKESPVLRELNLEFQPGLTVVFGKVGSGKSALLQGIMGELDCSEGSFAVPDTMIGYCAQLPWLQHMSIRDNILFSAPYDPERYSQVLDACSLLPDLASFKNGDLSDIGENGIGLSGGQKARVALARAVYSQSRILLLDDPIAALDHQTAESIVRKLFQGPLVADRTVVLVTHRVDLCIHLAKQIVEVEEGRARALDPEQAAQEVAKFLREEKEEEEEAAQEAESSETNDTQQAAAIPDKFVEEEHRAKGGVLLSVYWTYIRAGTLKLWAVLIVCVALMRFGSLLNYWFLKAWGEAYRPIKLWSTAGLDSFGARESLFDRLTPPDDDVRPWLLVYLGIALLQCVLFMLVALMALVMVYVSSKNLFARAIERVSKATFRFYDVTPVGRLMNRLVSDVGMLDGGIMSPLQQVVWQSVLWMTSMVVIASTTPAFFVFAVAMTIWFIWIFRQFLPTSQSLRRLETVSLSPLMSNFGILLDGLATIRAFKAQPHFQNRNIEVTDSFQKMDHFYWSLQSWLSYRFTSLSALSTFLLTLLALYNRLSPGLTAFVLTTAAQFVDATRGLCTLYGTLQMDFVSVERVIELLDLDEEPQGKLQPPAVWPSGKDDIVFDDVTLRYAEHLDPSIEDASFTIPGGSTCAVLGRTGSGKSTLALALLATMHPSKGAITVGTIGLSDVDVHQWRQRVSFVAQDPVLFPGSLRENLDPLGQFSDAECLAVLRRVLGTEWTLQSPVEGGGKNLSQGQRQLVGIGRAVLRRSAVVILDEATASIDKETAARVQDILREELTASTVITIAHRLEAVKDANYFVRLDSGRVVEHGPANETEA